MSKKLESRHDRPATDAEPGTQSTGQLSTWKEIGAYLGVDVRTAQRYEEELHLPVHRLESGARGRVYAHIEELEEWKRAKSQSPPWWRTVPGLQRATGLLSLFVVVMAGGLAWSLWPVRGPATHFGYRGSRFVAFTASGQILWSYRLPKPPTTQIDRIEDWPVVLVDDLDGDGGREAILWYRSKAYLTPDILMCFSAETGELFWQFTPSRSLRDRSEAFSVNYHIRSFKTLASPASGSGSRWVAVATVTAWGHPTILSLLDATGAVQREYVHSGHLEDLLVLDLNHDGKEEILAGGNNSSRNRATLVLLDPAALGGASVEPPDSPEQILDLPPATGELARMFIPRSPVSLQRRDISTALDLYPDAEGFVARVFEKRETADDWAFFSYAFTPDLSVTKVRGDEFMVAAWDRVRAEDPSVPPLDEKVLQNLADQVEVIRSDAWLAGRNHPTHRSTGSLR